jgi:hypothetical protein
MLSNDEGLSESSEAFYTRELGSHEAAPGPQGIWEVHMSSVNQPRSTFADDVGGGFGFDSERPDRVDELVSPALLGEAMIERAKSVVVVARRCDEDQAAQILLDAADKAQIPVRVAADQVMTALQDEVDHGGITQDTLAHVLDCVRPLEHSQDAGRGAGPDLAEVPGQSTAESSEQAGEHVAEHGAEHSVEPLAVAAPAHQAA